MIVKKSSSCWPPPCNVHGQSCLGSIASSVDPDSGQSAKAPEQLTVLNNKTLQLLKTSMLLKLVKQRFTRPWKLCCMCDTTVRPKLYTVRPEACSATRRLV